jgi:hypothetical protein
LVRTTTKTLGLSDQTLHNWLKAEVAGGVWDFSLDAYGGALHKLHRPGS